MSWLNNDKLKAKFAKEVTFDAYTDILASSIVPMFDYDGLPDTVDTRFIDRYKLSEGACAFWKNKKGDWIVSHVDFGGTPNSNGIGSIAICSTDNGEVKQFDDWFNNPDVAIMFNNRMLTADMNVGRFANLLTEIELSMKFNVIYSRLYPIPVAKDSKVRKALEEALNSMDVGKFVTILNDDALSNELGEGSGVDIVNITDVKNADKIQYLAHFRDDLSRWFYSIYGMNSQGSSKLAQQTQDEVNQDCDATMIIPRDRLNEAQKGIDMCNKKFGWNATVKFSASWESRSNKQETLDNHVEKEEDVVDNNQEGDNKDESQSED